MRVTIVDNDIGQAKTATSPVIARKTASNAAFSRAGPALG